MIIAERNSTIMRQAIPLPRGGGLASAMGTFYSEVQIINYTGEEICVLDYENLVARIAPEPGFIVSNLMERRIIIQQRYCSGKRHHTVSGYLEDTPSTQITTIIPYDALISETVFSEDVNALFYITRYNPGPHFHPHSEAYLKRHYDEVRDRIARDATYAPVTIMANDPAGKFKKLFIELNGHICSVEVTNYKHCDHEEDVVAIGIRDAINDDFSVQRVIKTSFAELLKKDPLCWEIGGFMVSADREWFEQKLEAERNTAKPNVVPSSEVEKLLTKVREEDKLIIEQKDEIIAKRDKTIKEHKQQYDELKSSYEDLLNNGFMKRNSKVAFDRLGIDEKKIEQSRIEADAALRAEQLKLQREQFNTLATVAKTIAVLAPMMLLAFKYFNQGST